MKLKAPQTSNSNMPFHAERLAYSVSEAASVTGLGRTTLFALIRDGQLPSRKIGNRRLIRKPDLEQFLRQTNDAPGV